MILSGGVLSELVLSGDGVLPSCIPADISRYIGLITPEHADKPNFVATVALFVQGMADLQCTLADMPGLFDLDVAVGDQLDKTGQWIGLTRRVAVPDAVDFFSFDAAGLGFDEGVWFSPFSVVTDFVTLDDPHYRTLLRAKVVANHWDGSIPGAYAAWETLFGGTGFTVAIQDLGHMRMGMLLLAPSLPVDDVTLALFSGGYLDLRPAGVMVEFYMVPTAAGAPYFGFDVESPTIAGFDVGAWGELLPPRWLLFQQALANVYSPPGVP